MVIAGGRREEEMKEQDGVEKKRAREGRWQKRRRRGESL